MPADDQNHTIPATFTVTGATGTVTPFGAVTASGNGYRPANAAGVFTGSYTFVLSNGSFSVFFSAPNGTGRLNTSALTGIITAGTGAYAGAYGTVLLSMTNSDNGNDPTFPFTLTGSGTLTVPPSTEQTISITNLSAGGGGTYEPAKHPAIPFAFTGSGSATVNGRPNVNVTVVAVGSVGPHYEGNSYLGTAQGTFTLTFANPAGSIYLPFQLPNAHDWGNAFASYTFNVQGGSGAYSGATGSLNVHISASGNDDGMGNPPVQWSMTGSGTITVKPPSAGSPVIASVTTASGGAIVSQNDWIAIKGVNLVPNSTPANDVIWSNAPDFAADQMPMSLNGVSVRVNGQPAFVYFYCSATTSLICKTDQINVLAPLGSALGPVDVVVYNGSEASRPFTVAMESETPTFLLFGATSYIVATHTDNSLLGPTSLYPGLSTPAKRGETVVLYGIGFGLPTTTPTFGSSSQSGPLPAQPACSIGSISAAVTVAALISPGLYVFAVVVPNGVPSGDNPLVCTYNGSVTTAGNLITIQ